MKALFLTPPITLEERYGRLAGAGSSAPALGILLLAAVARAEGHQAAVLDAAARALGLDEVLEAVRRFEPDLLGISSTTLTIANAAVLAQRARELRPGLTVVLGGPHVSAAPEETLRRFPAFDLAVLGEGEGTLRDLLAALAKGESLDRVAGLILRQGEEIVRTAPRPFLADLDRLPFPAWDLLDGFPRDYSPAPFKVRQLPAASLVTSRGCPNRCTFCDRSVFGSTCHGHSAGYVLEMVRTLQRDYGVRELSIEDDTFITFRKRLREICEGLVEMKLGLTWSCLGRVDQVSSESLALMKRAGCWQISYGIESGSQPILDRIGKRVTLEQIRRAVALTREAGLVAKGFFIVGHPGETAETLEETRRFALELPLSDLSVTLLTPFPGTELAARAAEYGTFDDDWSRLNLLNPVFVPRGLTRDDLVRAQQTIIRQFYLRPRVLADYAGRVLRNPRMLPGLLKGGLSLLKST